jgi:hypothetical protein
MSVKVLLINPWIADFAAYDLWAKPLGLLYVGKFLRQHGYQLELLDLLDRLRWQAGELDSRGHYRKTKIAKPKLLQEIPRHYGIYGATEEQFRKALCEIESQRVILLTSHMSYWYPGVVATVRVLREMLPSVPIVLGGTYATLYPEHAHLEVNPDYLIRGYGERQVLELLNHLFDRHRKYRELPEFDDRGQLPWDLYPRLKVVPLLTSRGCPYACSYCATSRLHPRFSQREPKDVIAEIDWVNRTFGVREFAFYDDALFANKANHVVPILRGIVALDRDLFFHSPNGLFASAIDLELAELMQWAGFKTVRLSLESLSPRWQAASSYKVSRQQFERALDFLEQAGFKRCEIEVYLIMGLPGQTFQEVRESLEFVASKGAISHLAAFTPIPGTEEWERARDMGYVTDTTDPLLCNNSTYPCRNAEFPVAKFSELRQLSNSLNAVMRQTKETIQNG